MAGIYRARARDIGPGLWLGYSARAMTRDIGPGLGI